MAFWFYRGTAQGDRQITRYPKTVDALCARPADPAGVSLRAPHRRARRPAHRRVSRRGAVPRAARAARRHRPLHRLWPLRRDRRRGGAAERRSRARHTRSGRARQTRADPRKKKKKTRPDEEHGRWRLTSSGKKKKKKKKTGQRNTSVAIDLESPGRRRAVGRAAPACGRTFGRSLHIRTVDTGSCAVSSPRSAARRPALRPPSSRVLFHAAPRHADLLMVTGPAVRAADNLLLKAYDATPDPKVVIAVGGCALGGAIPGTSSCTARSIASCPSTCTSPAARQARWPCSMGCWSRSGGSRTGSRHCRSTSTRRGRDERRDRRARDRIRGRGWRPRSSAWAGRGESGSSAPPCSRASVAWRRLSAACSSPCTAPAPRSPSAPTRSGAPAST